ncbi:hypothetical protein ACFFX0_06880 [Citricoccus parietis]|uniref:Uncharacterized protein n=1 Tax=Citricoccus parietis TaxID=592307 RepID=A0ABV5FWC3_9MICC
MRPPQEINCFGVGAVGQGESTDEHVRRYRRIGDRQGAEPHGLPAGQLGSQDLQAGAVLVDGQGRVGVTPYQGPDDGGRSGTADAGGLHAGPERVLHGDVEQVVEDVALRKELGVAVPAGQGAAPEAGSVPPGPRRRPGARITQRRGELIEGQDEFCLQPGQVTLQVIVHQEFLAQRTQVEGGVVPRQDAAVHQDCRQRSQRLLGDAEEAGEPAPRGARMVRDGLDQAQLQGGTGREPGHRRLQ